MKRIFALLLALPLTAFAAIQTTDVMENIYFVDCETGERVEGVSGSQRIGTALTKARTLEPLPAPQETLSKCIRQDGRIEQFNTDQRPSTEPTPEPPVDPEPEPEPTPDPEPPTADGFPVVVTKDVGEVALFVDVADTQGTPSITMTMRGLEHRNEMEMYINGNRYQPDARWDGSQDSVRLATDTLPSGWIFPGTNTVRWVYGGSSRDTTKSFTVEGLTGVRYFSAYAARP